MFPSDSLSCALFFLHAQLRELESSIQATVAEIDQTKLQAKDSKAKNVLLKQLRDELKQLRAKELQLRDELKPLHQYAKKYPLGSLPFPSAADDRFGTEVWAAMGEEVQHRSSATGSRR